MYIKGNTMNIPKKFVFLLLVIIANMHAMYDEEVAYPIDPPKPRKKSSKPYYDGKRRSRIKSKPVIQEEAIEEESARFGATQPDSESDSPEGFLHGESN
jgi:hypothetical protein